MATAYKLSTAQIMELKTVLNVFKETIPADMFLHIYNFALSSSQISRVHKFYSRRRDCRLAFSPDKAITLEFSRLDKNNRLVDSESLLTTESVSLVSHEAINVIDTQTESETYQPIPLINPELLNFESLAASQRKRKGRGKSKKQLPERFPVNFLLDSSDLDSLEKLAVTQGLKLSDLLRFAVWQYLENPKNKLGD